MKFRVNFRLCITLVDLHCRMLAFRGAGGEPPRCIRTFPLLPKESSIFDTIKCFSI